MSKKVVVGMSGGVDSSVAALLLKEKGFDVIGMMLRLWNETGKESSNSCCTPESISIARRVAAILGIPFYVIDANTAFKNEVVDYFISGLIAGETPNPCIRCNQKIRWGTLFEEAKLIGSEFIATGHYARLTSSPKGIVELRKGLDENKDQSYVLSGISKENLQKTLLPLGDLQKNEVRSIAMKYKLPSAGKKDSQDLCFLAGGDYRDFIRRNAPQITSSGLIKSIHGVIVGEHAGLHNFTIGQRKGLGSNITPHYVIRKDIESNTLWIGEENYLGSDTLQIHDMNWLVDRGEKTTFRAKVKIRYKAFEQFAEISPSENGELCVKFDKKLRDITPGQQAAIYDDDLCLGGGIIRQVATE
jgi:tRNA-specific 2-thiouridylase